jgi:exodeoxyribonuclease V alpha subunit
LDVENGFNLRHVETSSPTSIQDVVQKIVTKMEARKFDPIWDVQVISPTNSRSVLSCDGMNEVLQNQLNPLPEGEKRPDNIIFRKNDKVIQIKNTRLDDAYGTPTFLVNGDMGQIIDMNDSRNKMTVKFFDPERIVHLSKKRNDLLLAYCVTCHRMQGSEAPVVIIPVHKLYQYFVTRSWIYTAISRAKVMCFTVGQFGAIETAINKNDAEHRVTRLKESMLNCCLDIDSL